MAVMFSNRTMPRAAKVLLATTMCGVLASAGLVGDVVAQTPSPEGDSAILAPRLVPLAGVQNFRDIGGYRTVDGRRVKWGLIYRSSELSNLTPEDLSLVEGLNIETIHDLRSVEERLSEPTAWTGPDAPPIVAHDYELDLSAIGAMFRGDVTAERARDAFAALYPSMLEQQRPQETALFADLLEGDGSTLYHCTAGKDRTGLATALILSALGVPRETILYDYELSNRYYNAGVGSPDGSASAVNPALAQLPPEVISVFMGVEARYLREVFAHIDSRYGSVEAYLDRELGVDAADIQRLRSRYTE
jgi:protein-tyrosine phosphatase